MEGRDARTGRPDEAKIEETWKEGKNQCRLFRNRRLTGQCNPLGRDKGVKETEG